MPDHALWQHGLVMIGQGVGVGHGVGGHLVTDGGIMCPELPATAWSVPNRLWPALSRQSTTSRHVGAIAGSRAKHGDDTIKAPCSIMASSPAMVRGPDPGRRWRLIDARVASAARRYPAANIPGTFHAGPTKDDAWQTKDDAWQTMP
jgi:hypothetical protein